MKEKHIFNKILSSILVIMMMFSFSVNIYAEEDTSSDNAVARVGEKVYDSLGAAMSSANNAEVVLLKDVQLSDILYTTTGWNITLDLDGHTISGVAGLTRLINTSNSGTLTIKDSSNDGTGKLAASSTAIFNSSNLKILGGTIDAVYGIKQQNKGIIEISGGTIDAKNTAIDTGTNETQVIISGGIIKSLSSGNSSNTWEKGINAGSNTSITMTGGMIDAAYGITLSGSKLEVSNSDSTPEIMSNRNAIALNGDSSVTIDGGKFNGQMSAVYLDQSFNGDLTISSGDFKESGSSLRDISASGDLAITGGSFGQININGERSSKFITGGNFGYNPSAYVVEGYFAEKKADNTFDVKTIVAKMADKNYSSVQKAIDGSWNNVTITVLVDVKEDLEIPEARILTIDLNGCTITNVASHTIYNKGTLTIIDTSNNKNGKVDNITHAKAALYNEAGARATLNAGTFTRSNENGIDTENSGGNSFYTILNHGIMIFDQTVTVNQGPDQTGRFSSMIENGWYDGNKNITGTESKMTIRGGNFNGGLNTIKNDDYGILTIENGSFTNSSQAAVLNWNVATINNGTFEGSENVILNGFINDTMDKGELKITGGTFNAGNGSVICPNGNAGVIKVSGGTFNKPFNSKYLEGKYAAVLNNENYEVKELSEAVSGNVSVVLLNQTEQLPAVDGYVFAGWFADNECSTVANDSELTYAKFVKKEVLSVKVKLKDGTNASSDKTNIRFVTTVDDLKYKEIGFEITINGKTRIIPVKTVYKKIVAGNEGVSFDEELSSFSEASQYFATYTITNIPNNAFNTTISVLPYWITLSGEKVYGDEYTVTVNELC